jgi:hypothetical protein
MHCMSTYLLKWILRAFSSHIFQCRRIGLRNDAQMTRFLSFLKLCNLFLTRNAFMLMPDYRHLSCGRDAGTHGAHRHRKTHFPALNACLTPPVFRQGYLMFILSFSRPPGCGDSTPQVCSTIVDSLELCGTLGASCRLLCGLCTV